MISMYGALFLTILASTHGYANIIVRKPFNSLERDTLAVDSVSNYGLALRCLTDVVGDPHTINAIHKVMGGTVTRVKQIPAYSYRDYMDVVLGETTVSLASLASIHPVCANIISYCQHRNIVKKFASPPEINELQTYLSLTGPMSKCLMHKYGDSVMHQIYGIFEHAVDGIRADFDAHRTPVQMVLLQATYIGTQLMKLDKGCRKYALNYNHCANIGL